MQTPYAGRGSYGSVYKARVKESGEIVAIKVISLSEQEDLESIQKEINMLRDCDHPNVVKYFGSWRAADSLWIAMEYCAGGSLSDVMHACDAPLEETVISYVCCETLAGLAYLHALGRIHRDIKCGNILLTESGEVKLADFGVAAQLTSTLSKRNTFIGTPHWMAPEVIQASHYDGKVDVWALGISAIEMAERYPPRWRVNPNRVIFMVVRDPPPRLTDKERWSLAFQDFIAQCLQKDPRSRPTARYLQQHKFIARDKSGAIKALLPCVQKARAMFAEAAAAAAEAAAIAGSRGSARWSSFDASGANSYLQQQQPGGTVLVHPGDGGGGAGYEATLPSGAASSAAGRNNAASGNIADTMVIRSDPSGPQVSSSAAFASTILQRQSSEIGGGNLMPSASVEEPSLDYLAAVSAASAGGQASEDSMLSTPVIRPASAAAAAAPGRGTPSRVAGGGGGLVTEAQRVAERLRNIHSSGEVVPLPFLSATDACPLSLLGIDGGGAVPKEEPDWEAVLRQVLVESSEGTDPSDLPQSAVDRVKGSSTLLNLVAALVHRKEMLEWQRREGVGEAAQDALKAKAEALSDTLRTVLCL